MSGDFDRTKVKVNEKRLDNGFIIFLEYANIDTDTTIVFLGVIVTALWTIIEFGIMADCYIMPASLRQ